MKKSKVFITLTSIFIIGIASADMDWENRILRVTAADRATATESLKKDLHSLQYDENSTVEDFLRTHFDRENRLMGFILEYQNVKQNYLTDGSVEYVYELALTNKIMSLLLPDKKTVNLVVPMLCPYCGQEWPKTKPVPEGLELTPKQIETTEYTGIIIDCRGFKMNQCLFPKIYNELMEEIYSINFADFSKVIENGLALYSMQDLYSNARIGYNPLRIRAIGVCGNMLTDIKISSIDARRLHGSKNNIELLKECRVAIIF